jgi:DNA polymerase III subunit delta
LVCSVMPSATEHAFRKAVAAGSVAPVCYLHGDDDFRKDDSVSMALAAVVAPEWRAFDVDVRRGPDLDAGTIVALLETPPLAGPRRAVAIRDVGGLKKDARRELDRYLDRSSPTLVLLLVAGSGDRVDRTLADRAVAVDFPLLSGDRLPRWITHRAGELGVRIAPGAAALLQEAVGTDLGALASELDKLASYVRGRAAASASTDRQSGDVDEAAVAAVVGVRRGETQGDLLDRVAERDIAGALALIEHVLSQPKASAVGTVMALTTQTLALAWGHARRAQGTSANRLPTEFFSLLKETGANPMRPWGEAVATWVRSIDRWTPAALDRALAALGAADAALKETRMTSDEQVIATLILAMCADVEQHVPAPGHRRQGAAA